MLQIIAPRADGADHGQPIVPGRLRAMDTLLPQRRRLVCVRRHAATDDLPHALGRDPLEFKRQNWVKAGKLGHVQKVGNEYQVPLTGFERWWSANVQQTEGEKGEV